MRTIYLSVWIEAWRVFLTLWQVRPWLKAERRPRTEAWRGFLTLWQVRPWLKADRCPRTEPWWVFLTPWQRTTLLGMGRARVC
jgi:hypothetical protein